MPELPPVMTMVFMAGDSTPRPRSIRCIANRHAAHAVHGRTQPDSPGDPPHSENAGAGDDPGTRRPAAPRSRVDQAKTARHAAPRLDYQSLRSAGQFGIRSADPHAAGRILAHAVRRPT